MTPSTFPSSDALTESSAEEELFMASELCVFSEPDLSRDDLYEQIGILEQYIEDAEHDDEHYNHSEMDFCRLNADLQKMYYRQHQIELEYHLISTMLQE
ncbi:hypothetical protein GEMRC1_003128 [Eukaryota sp. GEM-RC1]